MSYLPDVYVVPYMFEPLGVSYSRQMREHANGRWSRGFGHAAGVGGAIAGSVWGGVPGGALGYAAGTAGYHGARRGFRAAMNAGANYLNRRQGYTRFR